MARDQRDPKAIGELLLRSGAYRRERLSTVADDLLSNGADSFPIPNVKSEGPLERYGDPRGYDVRVTTTIERIPIERLAAGPTG
jgi:hypothetical protein